jgi:hypothetical protein
MFWIQIRQDFWVRERPVLANFQATVTFLHLSSRLPGGADKALFFCQSKGRFHLVTQVGVIGFESQGIVASLLDTLFGNVGLRSHRINGYHAAGEHQVL